MANAPDLPDPGPFIHNLGASDAVYREAAAWSLGEIGSPRAARPLAGLLLREMQAVERTGLFANTAVVRAVAVAVRRIGAQEALYAVIKALCVLSRARGVDDETVKDLVETLAEVGGPGAVREAADKVIAGARGGRAAPGLEAVGAVLLERLQLCGDAAEATLQRVAAAGPAPLRPLARRYSALRDSTASSDSCFSPGL